MKFAPRQTESNKFHGQDARATILVLLLATWPVWLWLGRRIMDDPSEAVGLLAVVTALILLRETRAAAVRAPWLLPMLLLLLYAASFHAVLPLARGVIAVTALAAAISALRLGTRLHLPLWGLLLLALPVIPSLQFFLGYPLRVLVAQMTAPLLRGSGYLVLPAGACLRWGSELIAIDAPCSGVKMLWAAGFLTLALAWRLRLSPGRTLLAGLGALLAVLLGNALRAAALFFPEAGVITLPHWAHAAIGAIVFLLVGCAIIWWTYRIAAFHQASVSVVDHNIGLNPSVNGSPLPLGEGLGVRDRACQTPPAFSPQCEREDARQSQVHRGAPVQSTTLPLSQRERGMPNAKIRAGTPPSPRGEGGWGDEGARTHAACLMSCGLGVRAFVLAALLAAAIPLWQPATAHSANTVFPGWPTHFEGRALRPLPLSAREERFLAGFPGRIGRFTDGRRELVIRWVTQDTRLLHPAADCFRGLGYRITPQPLTRDADGRCWGTFHADRDGQTLLARELIYDNAHHSWSDPSAWYWSAALHHTPGPWWAVTVVEAAVYIPTSAGRSGVSSQLPDSTDRSAAARRRCR